MKNAKRRIISLLMALTLALSLLPTGLFTLFAAAAEPTYDSEESHFTYVWYSGSNTWGVQGYTGTSEYVQFPAQHKNSGGTYYTVTGVSNALHTSEAFANVTHVRIPSSVTIIGEYAFSELTKLTTVELLYGSQLKTIDTYAFEGCTALAHVGVKASDTSYYLPSSLNTISAGAFSHDTALTSVDLSQTQVTSIENGTFASSGLTSVSFPTSTGSLKIYIGAYECCEALLSVTLPAKLSYLDAWAFAGCKNLTFVTFLGDVPAGTSTGYGQIGTNCFAGVSASCAFTVPYSDYYNNFRSALYGSARGGAPAGTVLRVSGYSNTTMPSAAQSSEITLSVDGAAQTVSYDPNATSGIGATVTVTKGQSASFSLTRSGAVSSWSSVAEYYNDIIRAGVAADGKTYLTGAAFVNDHRRVAKYYGYNTALAAGNTAAEDFSSFSSGVYYLFPVMTARGSAYNPDSVAVGLPIRVVIMPESGASPTLSNNGPPSNLLISAPVGGTFSDDSRLQYRPSVKFDGFLAYVPESESLAVDSSTASFNGYTITYQWYGNTTNSTSGGTAISGATGLCTWYATDIGSSDNQWRAAAFPQSALSSAAEKVTYYYCLFTFRTASGTETSVASSPFTAAVYKPFSADAGALTVKGNGPNSGNSYYLNEPDAYLTVTGLSAHSSPYTMKYKWTIWDNSTSTGKDVGSDQPTVQIDTSSTAAGGTYICDVYLYLGENKIDNANYLESVAVVNPAATVKTVPAVADCPRYAASTLSYARGNPVLSFTPGSGWSSKYTVNWYITSSAAADLSGTQIYTSSGANTALPANKLAAHVTAAGTYYLYAEAVNSTEGSGTYSGVWHSGIITLLVSDDALTAPTFTVQPADRTDSYYLGSSAPNITFTALASATDGVPVMSAAAQYSTDGSTWQELPAAYHTATVDAMPWSGEFRPASQIIDQVNHDIFAGLNVSSVYLRWKCVNTKKGVESGESAAAYTTPIKLTDAGAAAVPSYTEDLSGPALISKSDTEAKTFTVEVENAQSVDWYMQSGGDDAVKIVSGTTAMTAGAPAFTVSASGSGTMTSTLTIPVMASVTGTYSFRIWAVASNGAVSASSARVLVVFNQQSFAQTPRVYPDYHSGGTNGNNMYQDYLVKQNASLRPTLYAYAEVSDGGVLSYQWYKTASDERDNSAVKIAGASGTVASAAIGHLTASYTLTAADVATAGDAYYFVEFSNLNSAVAYPGIAETEDTRFCKVRVSASASAAAQPVLTRDLRDAAETVHIGDWPTESGADEFSITVASGPDTGFTQTATLRRDYTYLDSNGVINHAFTGYSATYGAAESTDAYRVKWTQSVDGSVTYSCSEGLAEDIVSESYHLTDTLTWTVTNSLTTPTAGLDQNMAAFGDSASVTGTSYTVTKTQMATPSFTGGSALTPAAGNGVTTAETQTLTFGTGSDAFTQDVPIYTWGANTAREFALTGVKAGAAGEYVTAVLWYGAERSRTTSSPIDIMGTRITLGTDGKLSVTSPYTAGDTQYYRVQYYDSYAGTAATLDGDGSIRSAVFGVRALAEGSAVNAGEPVKSAGFNVQGTAINRYAPGGDRTFSAECTSPDGGTITYQWYRYDGNDQVAIANTSPTYVYTPLAGQTAGTSVHLRVAVTNTKRDVSGNQTSVASYDLWITYKNGPVAPTINNTLTDKTFYIGGSETETCSASISASADTNVLNYQWQYSPDNGTTWFDYGGTGGNAATLTLPVTGIYRDAGRTTLVEYSDYAAGTSFSYKLRCRVYTTDEGMSGEEAAAFTNTVSITVNPLPQASGDVTLTGADHLGGETAPVVNAPSVSLEGLPTGTTYTYQWKYRQVNWSSGSDLSGRYPAATTDASSVTLSGYNADISFYVWCVITPVMAGGTTAQGGLSYTTPELLVPVRGTDAAEPGISETACVVDEDARTAKLTVTAYSKDNGVLTYQWYVMNNGSYELITGATGAEYSVPVYAPQSTGYKVVVTNTQTLCSGNKTATNYSTRTLNIPGVVITSADPPASAARGQSFSYTPAASAWDTSGNTGTPTWSLSGVSPANWVSLGAGNAVTGTVPSSGSSASFTLTASATLDGKTYTAVKTYTLALKGAAVTSTSPLPDAPFGVSYSQQLTSAGSGAWSLTSGALPAGLSLSAAGLISGTPNESAIGNYAFTARITAGAGDYDEKAFELNVVGSIVDDDSNKYVTVNGSKYSTDTDNSGTGWSWSAAKKTLTLSGFSGTSLSFSSSRLYTVLVGTNNISSSDDYRTAYLGGTLYLAGSGSLTVENTYSASGQNSIAVYGGLVHAGSGLVTLTASGAEGQAKGVYGSAAVSGSGSLTVTAAGKTYARGVDGALTVTGGGNVSVTAQSASSGGSNCSTCYGVSGALTHSGSGAVTVSAKNSDGGSSSCNCWGVGGDAAVTGSGDLTVTADAANGAAPTACASIGVWGALNTSGTGNVSVTASGSSNRCVAAGWNGKGSIAHTGGKVELSISNCAGAGTKKLLDIAPTVAGYGYVTVMKLNGAAVDYSAGKLLSGSQADYVSWTYPTGTINITTASPLPGGTIGQPYSVTLAAAGATGTVTWAVKSGSTLPSWLTLDTGTGALSGTPTAEGTYAFTLTASSASYTPGEKEFTLTVVSGHTVSGGSGTYGGTGYVPGVSAHSTNTTWLEGNTTVTLTKSGETAPAGTDTLTKSGGSIHTETGVTKEDYSFATVQDGTYTLTVQKAHFAPVTVTVTVTGADSGVPTVELYMWGDTTEDGNINVFDAMKIVQHANGVIDLSGEVQADVDGNGSINVFDAMKIVQHANGVIDVTDK